MQLKTKAVLVQKIVLPGKGSQQVRQLILGEREATEDVKQHSLEGLLNCQTVLKNSSLMFEEYR